MRDASISGPARFRPTWRQAAGRGLYLGVLAAGTLLTLAVFALLLDLAGGIPPWLWPLLVSVPPVAGILGGVLVGRRLGTDIDARGIRTVSVFTRVVEPWSRVVDLRAERRGGRTVVCVYLETGGSVQLRAPYDGDLFAADPRFELKVFALCHLWRSHRFGGLSG